VTSLDDYLSGEFADFDRERRHIDDVIKETIIALENLFEKEKGWPYEISLSNNRGDYKWARMPSTSTIAMISAALATAAGRAKMSILARHVEWQPEGKRRSRAQNEKTVRIIHQGLELVLKQAKEAITENKRWTFRSGTFGVDDVFTLCWLAELQASVAASPNQSQEEKTKE